MKNKQNHILLTWVQELNPSRRGDISKIRQIDVDVIREGVEYSGEISGSHFRILQNLRIVGYGRVDGLELILTFRDTTVEYEHMKYVVQELTAELEMLDEFGLLGGCQ